MAKLKHLRKAREKQLRKLTSLPNVIGSALGRKSVEGKLTSSNAIIVFVRKKKPKKKLNDGVIPKSIHFKGHKIRTDVVELKGIEPQFGGPPFVCSDRRELGMVSAMCRDGDEVFAATCAHCLKGPDLDYQTPDEIDLRNPASAEFLRVGISNSAIKSTGRGVPGNYGFLDAGLFTIEDPALASRIRGAPTTKVWDRVRTGTKVWADLSDGTQLQGIVSAVEIQFEGVFADICVEMPAGGTYKGDSGLMWRTDSGTAVAVHALGSIEQRGTGSRLSFCMSAKRMMSALGVEFVDLEPSSS